MPRFDVPFHSDAALRNAAALFVTADEKDSAPLWEATFASPLGDITALGTDRGVCALAFSPQAARDRAARRSDATATQGVAHPIASLLEQALAGFFSGDLEQLNNVPVDVVGTPFQLSVWRALRAVPAGRTATYGDLAVQLSRVGAERAVGAANGHNPVALVLPCHRIIGSTGKLIGYAFGIDKKRALLVHEGALLA